jgi:uncharacterized protein YjbI with pentapeptide repeats
MLAGAALAGCIATGLVAVPAHASAAAQCPSVNPVNGDVTPPPESEVDWSGCDLAGANLRYVDIGFADLSDTNLTGATMDGSSFRSTNFTGADLSHAYASAEFGNDNMTDANFAGADAVAADFDGADLQGAELGSADITNAASGSITGVPASLPANWRLLSGYLLGPGATLAHAQLSGLDLTGYDLAGADLSFASLTNTVLAGSDLTGVVAGDITTVPASLPADWVLKDRFLLGPGVSLDGQNLSGDNLSGTDLAGAFLWLANLTDASLAGVSLQGADLKSAELGGADLSTSDLQSVSSGGITGSPALPANWQLTGGYLTGPGADLHGAQLDEASLAGQDLSGADLSVASLEAADLSGADLGNADLQYADLDEANVAGATFAGAQWFATICPDGTGSNLYVDGCFSPLDTTAPVAHPAITAGVRGARGWFTSPVTVTWNWTDDGTINPSLCTTTSTSTGSGYAVTLEATCTDWANNADTEAYAVKVDLTRPVVAVTGVRNGHTYRRGHVPVAGCRTTELVSGVATRAKVKVTVRGRHGIGKFTATCTGAVSIAGTRQARVVRITYKVIT